MEIGRNLSTSGLLFKVNSAATYNVAMFTNFVLYLKHEYSLLNARQNATNSIA
jgi:hypothetical protein